MRHGIAGPPATLLISSGALSERFVDEMPLDISLAIMMQR